MSFSVFFIFLMFARSAPGYYPRKAGKVLLPIKHSEHIR